MDSDRSTTFSALQNTTKCLDCSNEVLQTLRIPIYLFLSENILRSYVSTEDTL